MQKISYWYIFNSAFIVSLLISYKNPWILILFLLNQPVGDVGDTNSMYKEVVLGGDVWDLLDELMIYMGNPMQYYEKGVKFVRVTISSIIKIETSFIWSVL